MKSTLLERILEVKTRSKINNLELDSIKVKKSDIEQLQEELKSIDSYLSKVCQIKEGHYMIYGVNIYEND